MRILIFSIIVSIVLPLFAQTNLVPNGGFEEYVECPSNYPGNADVYLAEPWFGYSTDYMHACAGYDPFYVEANEYSSPRTGEAYVMGASYLTIDYNEREYVQVQLISPLEIGELYCVEYYCKLYSVSGIGIDGMGAFFTENFAEWADIMYYNWPTGDPAPTKYIVAEAQVISDVIHADTLNYTKVSGSFVAQEAYNYVTLGNFVDDNKLNFENVTNPLPAWGGGAAYAIDDVSVFKCDVSVAEQASLAKVYPYGDQLYIKHLQSSVSIAIYDLRGVLLAQEEFQTDASYDLSFLPSGMYVYRLHTDEGYSELGKIVF